MSQLQKVLRRAIPKATIHNAPGQRLLNRRNMLLGAAALAGAGAAAAATEDGPVLTMHGAMAGGNDEAHKFTLAQLMALQSKDLTTKTPWDGKETKYTGIDLQFLYNKVGGFGSNLRLRALNDFTATISVGELKQYGPIAAWAREGKLMPIEDKGPLFVVFPFSSKPELWNEEFFAKCVWQLCEIEIGD